MRKKEILLNGFSDICTLQRYLYSDPENYIEVENIFETKLSIYMDDKMEFIIKETGCIWDNTINNMLNAIEQLKESKSNNKNFKNRWEEIKFYVSSTIALNL